MLQTRVGLQWKHNKFILVKFSNVNISHKILFMMVNEECVISKHCSKALISKGNLAKIDLSGQLSAYGVSVTTNFWSHICMDHFNGLEQDYNISSALAMEILQYCTKVLIRTWTISSHYQSISKYFSSKMTDNFLWIRSQMLSTFTCRHLLILSDS